jgi:acyl-CoA hydrolase
VSGAETLDFSRFLGPDRGPRAGRRATAGEAIAAIPDGGRVFVAASCSTPLTLCDALAESRNRFRALELAAGHLRVPLAPFAHLGKPFRFTSLQPSPVLREYWSTGFVDPVDVALVQVSAPGPDGRVSLGTSVGSTLDLVRGTPLVIAQVNSQMPYTFGAGELPTTAFDYLVEAERPLPEIVVPEPDATARQIAKHAAAEIPDGATLQFGIGAIPEAILSALAGHRDLGIHGGMLSDACIDLCEAGALTGARKSWGAGILVAAEVIGTRRLYDWVHRNPLVHLAPSRCSHGAAALADSAHFVAINSAVEIALDGTVNAESIGAALVSGPGGQPDFAIGASVNAAGRSLLALPATAARGKLSRIVKRIDPAATVTLPRYLVDRIVTEYGVARLRGLPLGARREALAAIAHPDFRPELLA